ncbi:MAG: 50S ribosomal protein L32e [Thermoplasmatota archaeon]
MTKEDFQKILTSLDGIGKSKADALIHQGYDTVEKIQSASIEDLIKTKGISETVARSLQDQLGKKYTSKPKKEKAGPKQKQTAERKPKDAPVKKQKKETAEIKEPEIEHDIVEGKEKAVYQVKRKPKLPDDIKKHLTLRKTIKKHTPEFLREEWFRYKRIPRNWRRPDGITSKMRRHFKYRPSVVSIGFRGPKNVRGLHPSGFEEVLIYTVSDLERINPERQAARIGGSVGTKKRLEIEKKAKELDIRLLNK